MAEPLFEIQTDRSRLAWSPRGSASHTTIGRLAFRSLRTGLVFRSCRRAGLDELVSRDPAQQMGPALREETDYQVFVQGEGGRRVELTHRDPNITHDLHAEDGGRIFHGTVNFRSQVGNSEFVLKVDGEPELTIEVEVFPTKLDYKSDYQQLLADVQGILVGLALEYLRATHHKGQQVRTPAPSDLEWVLLLRHVVDELEKGLRHAAFRPVRGLVRKAQTVRVERVKRVDSYIRSEIRRGSGSGRWVKMGPSVAVRERLNERCAEPSLDTHEHRWLATQVLRIRRRLAQLRQVEGAVETKHARRRQALGELASLEQRMARLGQLEPLAATQGLPPPGFASLQLIGAPGYRDAYKACLELTLGLRITGGPMDLSVKDLNVLYEYWCFLALLQIVAEETGETMDPKDLLQMSQQGLRVMLKKGQETKTEFRDRGGRSIEVRYNPSFSRPEVMLIPQTPDMMLTVSEPQVWPRVHLLLDAKYRLERSPEYCKRYGTEGPPEDALNVLHRYRDAILEIEPGSWGRLGRTVVLAGAAFPHREPAGEDFSKGKLWQSFERIGVGAVPLLPGSTEYLKEWVRKALREGGWALADRVLPHVASEQARAWRTAAAEPVLVGVLRPDWREHLEWVRAMSMYYIPQSKDQPRQYTVKAVAIYVPGKGDSGGAVRFWAAVKGVQTIRRGDIDTPWTSHQGTDKYMVLYRLVHLEELTQPIENESGNGESQRVSGHRWTSRLGLDRARTITELLLETEAEWRLFEELRASGVPFTVNSAGVPRYESTGYRGHALFRVKKNRTTATIQYYGASGFRVVLDEGNEEFAASIQRVRSIISD
jgi:hypothetical protein